MPAAPTSCGNSLAGPSVCGRATIHMVLGTQAWWEGYRSRLEQAARDAGR